MKPNIPRLRKLVELMMYDEDPEKFDMLRYTHDCGTPACLFGHARIAFPKLDKLTQYGDTALKTFGIDFEIATFLFSMRYDNKMRIHDTPAIAACRVLDVIEAYTD